MLPHPPPPPYYYPMNFLPEGSQHLSINWISEYQMNTLFFGWWWVGGGLTSLDWTLLNLFSSFHLLPWVGDISSSFLGEVRSKNGSYIPKFYPLQYLPQSTELKSNNILQPSPTYFNNQVQHISNSCLSNKRRLHHDVCNPWVVICVQNILCYPNN